MVHYYSYLQVFGRIVIEIITWEMAETLNQPTLTNADSMNLTVLRV